MQLSCFLHLLTPCLSKQLQKLIFLHFLTYLMSWEEAALKRLDAKLGGKAFTAEEAVRLLHKDRRFSAGTTYRLIHDFIENGNLVKLGRGLYRIPRESTVSLSESTRLSHDIPSVSIPDVDEIARRALLERGIPFMITGPSLLYPFAHHFPRKMIHLVYVVNGGGDNAIEALKEKGLRSLLKPSRDETNLALTEFPEADLFIVRESLDITGAVDGAATLERALVDTYFETTRRRIPLAAEEFGRMASNAFATKPMSISHLLMLAGRRGVRPELRTVIEKLIPDLELPGAHVNNKKVESVLKGIASEAR